MYKRQQFVNNKAKFRIDDQNVHLSSIFKWYGKDFVEKFGGSENKFSSWAISKDYQSVITFALPLLPEKDQKALLSKKRKAPIIKYDWGLNEQ